MGIEYKAVHVGGVTETKDEGNGIVTAYVSITGVEDNVGDVIEAGAYKRTLTKRTPKGVWGHQWLTPTSKTLAADELPPGHPDLPAKLSDGTPWPKEAGALRIKMQFNLDTKRGREAYSDVQFFGDQQEWSIGYTVPAGASFKDNKGIRHIKDLDLFEYSPVLFGANSHARTAVSVKELQFAKKRDDGVSVLELKSMEEQIALFRKTVEDSLPEMDESAASEFEGDAEAPISEDEFGYNGEGDEDADEAVPSEDDPELTEEELDEEESEQEEKDLLARISAGMSLKDIRSAYNVLGKFLEVAEPDNSYEDFIELGTKALIEAKATGYDTIVAAVDDIDVNLDPADAKDLRSAASDLDSALQTGDHDGAQESATLLLDTLEKVMSENTDDDISLKTVARTVADKASGTAPGEDEEDPETDNWEEEEDDEEEETKSLVFMAGNGVEYKRGPWAGRLFGGVVGGSDLTPEDRQRAFVTTLPNRALTALEFVLDETRGAAAIKQIVFDEVDSRDYAGSLTYEQKMKMTPNGRGQYGRGGGRHRQAAEGRTPGAGLNFGETGRASKPSAKVVKRATKGVKKPGTSKKTVSVVSGTKKPVNRMAGGDQTEYKNYTLPDGSFPIPDVAHLKKAIQACGRAKDQDKAKAHIKSRAKALGREDLIPDEWKSQVVSTVEVKGLADFLNSL